MGSVLDFIAERGAGIRTALLAILVLTAVVNWFLWMFGWGRFSAAGASSARGGRPTTIRYVMAEFFVQIVNDFRHLLALVLVSLFAIALFLAMVPPLFRDSGPDLDAMRDGLQAVAAALGGLIGSIVGYYFGESAAKRGDVARPEVQQPVVQAVPSGGAPPAPAAEPPIRPPAPPGT